MHLLRRFLILSLALLGALPALCGAPKYVILFVGDGFGMNARSLVETAMGEPLLLNSLPSRARMTTSNALNETTDSAAGGTAIACGVKTVNRAIGVDKDLKPVDSIATRLQARGFKIGMVSSSPLNDATPAAYYAHQNHRKHLRAIIDEMAASGFECFGGTPPVHGDKELDAPSAKLTRDICEKNGYLVFEGETCLEQSRQTPSDKKVCLWFTPDTPRFNKPAERATLADFTKEAIRRLDNPDGFFLMVEKGDIDYAGHGNDSGKLVWEVLDFDKAVKVGLDFQKERPDDVLIIVTADHETGGLELDNPTHESLERLFRQKEGLVELQKTVKKLAKEAAEPSREKVVAILENALLSGEPPFTQTERARICAAYDKYVESLKKPTDETLSWFETIYGKYCPPVVEAFHIRDERAKIRFTTFRHSNADVWTSAVGPGHESFATPMDNTDISKKIEAIVFPQVKQ